MVGEGEDGGLRREARWWVGVAEGWEEGGVRLEGREGEVEVEGDPYAVYEVLLSEAEEGASPDGDVETQESTGWRSSGEVDEEVDWSPGPSPISSSSPSPTSSSNSSPVNPSTRNDTEKEDADEGDSLWDELVET